MVSVFVPWGKGPIDKTVIATHGLRLARQTPGRDSLGRKPKFDPPPSYRLLLIRPIQNHRHS